MADLTLTGAIPGLLTHGAEVALDYVAGTIVATGPDLSLVGEPPHGEVWLAGAVRRVPLAALILRMGPSGRDRCVRWLRERGHELRWADDEPEVLAWSVLSVHRGGKPIRGVRRSWVEVGDSIRGNLPKAGNLNPDLAALDRTSLADGYALRNDDGALTLPPLPEVALG